MTAPLLSRPRIRRWSQKGEGTARETLPLQLLVLHQLVWDAICLITSGVMSRPRDESRSPTETGLDCGSHGLCTHAASGTRSRQFPDAPAARGLARSGLKSLTQ